MEDHLNPTNTQNTTKILEIDKYFYKIMDSNDTFRIGFFILIKYQNKNLPVLITTNDNEPLNDTFILFIDNNMINLKFEETTYKDNNCNIQIREIKDNIKEKINYLETDDILYQNKTELELLKDSIYFINIFNDDEIIFSSDINMK